MKTFLAILAAGTTITVAILGLKKFNEVADSVTKTSNDYDATLTQIKTKLGI